MVRKKGEIKENIKEEYGPKIDRDTGHIEFTDSYTEYMNTFRRSSGVGESWESDEEYQESKDERRQKRKQRQRRRRRVVALCTVIAAVLVIVLFAVGQAHSVYDNEDDFESFSDQQFRKMRVLPKTRDRLITYQYGETTAFAYRFDPTDNEDLAVFRDQQVADLKQDFEKAVKKEIKKAQGNGNKLFRKGTNHAMLFDSAVYDSGNGALTMAIYTVEYAEDDGKMKQTQRSIQTYILNAKTLKVLNPLQMLNPDYKEKTAAYCTKTLKKDYKEDEFAEDASQYLKEDNSNYNQLVMSDGEMTVFFDQGTVVDEEEGVVSVTVPKKVLGTAVRGRIIDRYIDPDKPMVAITYDDGPGGKSEDRILKCLKKNGAVATFFYLGNRVDYAPENIKMAYEIGCEVGNHSWDHADLTGLSAKGIRSELSRTNKAIAKVIGVEPEVFRPPYGSYNDNVLKASKMPAILWSVDTVDWSSRNAKAVYKVIKKTDHLDGRIILMHSIYDSTAKATEKIVPYLQKEGYQLVTVSELIKYKTGEAPKAGKSYD